MCINAVAYFNRYYNSVLVNTDEKTFSKFGAVFAGQLFLGVVMRSLAN
jgi:hypothetical protein